MKYLLFAVLFLFFADLRADFYVLRLNTPAVVTLPEPKGNGGDYWRRADGSWVELQTKKTAAGRVVKVDAAMLGSASKHAVYLAKPEWLNLADQKKPILKMAFCNGRKLEQGADGQLVFPNFFPGDDLELSFDLVDGENPLQPQSATVQFSQPEGIGSLPIVSGLQPGERAGRLVVRLPKLQCGSYMGKVMVADCAPEPNVLEIPIEFRVVGISISPDKQKISLVTSGNEYVFQPHLSQQLLLPDGQWAKLTSRLGDWLYPHTFSKVEVRRGEHQQTVAVVATTQSIKGKPVSGKARLEFELTVHDGYDALFVSSRTVNIGPEAADCSANWGWLSAASYTLPEGEKKWQGKALNKYITIGTHPWMWLAPSGKRETGLAWISRERFGESRFDTMLLYGADQKKCPPEKGVGIDFVIAPAASAEEARALHDRLKEAGLLRE